jgi:membrane protein DedA with SNARE-associated domain
MEWLSPEYLTHLIATYGYVAIAVIIGLESMGLPLPGESALVIAALYASRHNQSIAGVVTAAATGAILGDNIGYWVGREFGYRLLLRYGGYIGLTTGKIKLGQYLFLRHGGKVVFFGRFVAILRILAAFLAGVNRMEWRRFLLANAAGAILWSSAVGLGAYVFGKALLRVTGPLGIVLIAVQRSADHRRLVVRSQARSRAGGEGRASVTWTLAARSSGTRAAGNLKTAGFQDIGAAREVRQHIGGARRRM